MHNVAQPIISVLHDKKSGYLPSIHCYPTLQKVHWDLLLSQLYLNSNCIFVLKVSKVEFTIILSNFFLISKKKNAKYSKRRGNLNLDELLLTASLVQ